MTATGEIADFALGLDFEDLSEETVDELKKRVLDSAGIAVAAMYNTALVRYLDFTDSFLAPNETPHPGDNVAGVIACGEYADASGADS